MNLESFSKEYFRLLTEDYSTINLTRILDYQDFYLKQIIDSIYPYDQSDVFKSSLKNSKTLVDVGFGGGFPLLPLVFHVEHQFKSLGIDSKKKKCDVVKEISQKLNLDVNFYHSRIEDILFDKKSTITFKAVGKVYDFLSRLNYTTDIEVFFYKGPSFYTLEQEELNKAKNSWNIIEEKEINVPGTDKRYLIGFKNKVPRGTKNKSAVKISQIL